MPRMPIPPSGVISLNQWEQYHPEPTLLQLYDRYVAVNRAINRYMDAELVPPDVWYLEVWGFIGTEYCDDRNGEGP